MSDEKPKVESAYHWSEDRIIIPSNSESVNLRIRYLPEVSYDNGKTWEPIKKGPRLHNPR